VVKKDISLLISLTRREKKRSTPKRRSTRTRKERTTRKDT
jgi:hypothetical protein